MRLPYEGGAVGRMATALWRRVLGELDWSRLDGCGDECGEMNCRDTQPVSASVASVFLAAAARACSDAETAERLERAVDAKYLMSGHRMFVGDWLIDFFSDFFCAKIPMRKAKV